MKQLLVIMTVFLITISCEKETGSGLEIYLLKAYQTKTSSKEIISGTEKLGKNPIISYQNIIYYDSADFYFKIDSAKAKELNLTAWSTQGTAFSLTVEGTVIYSGYFMPGYSSYAADWFILDPLSTDSKIYVRPGFPMNIRKLFSIDPRNDSRIIALLKKDNKLKN
jgi:hypothetical protein